MRRLVFLALAVAACHSSSSKPEVTPTPAAAAEKTPAPTPPPAAPAPGSAATPEATLDVGSPAPDFSLPGTDGHVHRLSDDRGKVVVLAWYPKAFTGG
jgi:hypothetical protein